MVLYPETGAQAAQWLARTFDQPSIKTMPIGIGATRDFIAEVAQAGRHRSQPRSCRASIARRVVFALGRLDLPHRQARRSSSAMRRTRSRRRESPQKSSDSQSSVSAPTAANLRVRFARPPSAMALRAAHHRRLSGSRGENRRAAARAGSRHADGAAHRQAPRHSLRGHLRAGSRAGFPGALFAANGLRGRQCALRHLGASADDGLGRASADHVPRRLRIQRRSARLASGHSACEPAPARSSRHPRTAGARLWRRGGHGPVLETGPSWAPEAEKELGKIPFFVRGKARRNTERFASERSVGLITVETLYDAKAHFQPLTDPLRFVMVTMDSHLSSATARAARGARRIVPALTLSIHAADEWGTDPEALHRCCDDIARGDIIVATMLFMEDHFQPLLEALRKRREHCDAMSAPCRQQNVVADADGPLQHGRQDRAARSRSSSGCAAAKKAGGSRRRGPDEDAAADSAVPALHSGYRAGCARLLPDAAILAGGLRRQHREHGRFLVGRYAAGPRAGLPRPAKEAPPIEYPRWASITRA